MSRSRAPWRFSLRTLSARPRLLLALGVGVGATIVAALARLDLSPWVLGWDAFCLAFLGTMVDGAASATPESIRAQSARQDEGQGVILVIVIAAGAASLTALGAELAAADPSAGQGTRDIHLAFAVATVALSWMLMHAVFALHYAHEYYAADPDTGEDRGGLTFPGGEPPDYWDFLHFALIIGVATQTADVAFTDRRLRHLGTVHSLAAFLFNALVIALAVNLAMTVLSGK